MSHYPQTARQAAAYESMLFKSVWILALSGVIIGMCAAYFFNPAAATPDSMTLMTVLGTCLFIFVNWTLFDVFRGAK